MEMMIVALLAFLSGYAHYEYKAPSGCSVEVHSFRIMGGASISIDNNCSLTAGAKDMARE